MLEIITHELTEETSSNGFVKYNSIENSYKKKYVDIVSLLNITEWCISEKVDGSNALIHYNVNEDTIKYGRRSDFLAEGEKHYNFQRIASEIPNLLEGFRKLCKVHNYKTIEIFGEVFGGNYKHEEVEPIKGATKVQKGVYYCPDNAFLAFDIKIDGEYVNTLLFESLCIILSIPYIPVQEFKGNVYEAIEYCDTLKDKPSEIYKLYNLPEIENNIREGVVLKPMVTVRSGNGGRVILKVKNEKFLEISAHQPKVHKELPEALQGAVSIIESYCTSQRLNNVLSHLGEVSISDFSKVIREFLADIYNDFGKDGNSLEEFSKEERGTINKKVNSIISPMIRIRLMEMS